jgi:hypothetical protein
MKVPIFISGKRKLGLDYLLLDFAAGIVNFVLWRRRINNLLWWFQTIVAAVIAFCIHNAIIKHNMQQPGISISLLSTAAAAVFSCRLQHLHINQQKPIISII